MFILLGLSACLLPMTKNIVPVTRDKIWELIPICCAALLPEIGTKKIKTKVYEDSTSK